MNKKELKKIILTIILVLVISIIVFLIGQYIVNKNRKYTGSMVGKYIYYWTYKGEPNGHSSYVILYNNATCESGSTLSGIHGYDCTYVRTDDKIILHYYAKGGQKYINITYLITPEGNLKKDISNDIYYRQ